MQMQPAHQLPGLPREGQLVEFFLDGRDISIVGTYAQQTFRSRWSAYDVGRVRSWRSADHGVVPASAKQTRMPALVMAAGLFAFAASAQAQDQITRTTASDGTEVTLHSGQPARNQYGKPPAFASLDADGDGFISCAEAEAYIPLFNDFEYLAHHASRISKSQFTNWVQTQTR